jgi:hypothetical protein
MHFRKAEQGKGSRSYLCIRGGWCHQKNKVASLDQNRKFIQPCDGAKKSMKICKECPSYMVIVIENMELPLQPDMVFTH